MSVLFCLLLRRVVKFPKSTRMHTLSDEILAALSPLVGKWEYAEPLSDAVRDGKVRPDILERLATLIRDAANHAEAERREIEITLALETAKYLKRTESAEKRDEGISVTELLEAVI